MEVEMNIARRLGLTGSAITLGVALALAVLVTSNTPVHANSQPDLIVIGTNVSDSSPEPGGKFWLIVTVTNQGDGQSAPTTLRYKRSTDATISTSDTTIGTEAQRALVRPQGSAHTIKLTAPSTPGTYYYGACVDSVADESDTTNDCSSSARVTVTQANTPETSEPTAPETSEPTAPETSEPTATPTSPQGPAAPTTPTGVIGMTSAATASELPGNRLLIQRHDVPDASLELAIGSISGDCATVVMAGVIRDESFGQTYVVVRREADGQVVRRWVSPDSPLVDQIPWPIVNTQYTVPVGVVAAIPLDDQCPQPNLLARRFDGGDDRIFGYDADLQQWRHVPDIPTFQALGFYWCNVTTADTAFFERIAPGSPYPVSQSPARDDYPNCLTS